MKLSGNDSKFLVAKKDILDPIWVFYQVKEWESERLLRTFTAKITQTQATRPQLEQDIARWCQLNSDKLPKDGGVVGLDLNNVQRF